MNVKPILTASAIALILTGCGGSSDNAESGGPRDPSAPSAPQGGDGSGTPNVPNNQNNAQNNKSQAEQKAKEEAKKKAEAEKKKKEEEAKKKAEEEKKRKEAEEKRTWGREEKTQGQKFKYRDGVISGLKKADLIKADGRLDVSKLKKADHTWYVNHDAGIIAIAIKKLGLNGSKHLPDAFEEILNVPLSDLDIGFTLRDPRAFGWSYQTFGSGYEYSDQDMDKYVYASVGKPLDDEAKIPLKATYNGYAMGKILHGAQGGREVISVMTAELDNKSMDFALSKSVELWENGSYDPYTDPIDHQTSACDQCNFTQRITWNATSKAFEGGGVRAYLYGPKAEEIGGTFSRSNVESPGLKPGEFIGAFGGKR